MKRAFTLIELLVVIAIIAILAAILFPVFAQAKVAAKKASSISNVKQLNTATQIYLADYDDNFPLQAGQDNFGNWAWGSWQSVPADWTTYAGINVWSQGSWFNSIYPYGKNGQLYESPNGVDLLIPGTYAAANALRVKAPYKTGYGYNGLLSSYSSTAVNSPATTPLASQVGGKDNVVGFDTGPFPAMYCPQAGQGCRFVPGGSGCGGYGNGTLSYYFYGYNTEWIYGNVQTWTYTDGHAGVRKMGMNYGATARTDYRTDPLANYPKADGKPGTLAWYDQWYCHAIVFAPDWDGTTIVGTPYAGY